MANDKPCLTCKTVADPEKCEKKKTAKHGVSGFLINGVNCVEGNEKRLIDAIVPPVKIGQVLWCNIPHSEVPLECRVYCICREERNGLVLDYFRCTVKGWFAKAFSFEDVGKTVFLTKEDALAKMDGERTDNV